MCLAIVSPAGKIVPKEHLENGFAGNSDGAGFAVATPDRKLIIKKGFFKFDEFHKAYLPYENLPCLIHFRIGTSGKKDAANCHPWRITEDVALIHNGILPMKVDGDLSDTGIFSRHLMTPHFQHMPKEWWKSQSFRWLFEEAIGFSNKIAIMDNEGEVVILNETHGEWDNGVWYSNSGYKWKRGLVCYSGRHDDYDGFPRGTRFSRDSHSGSALGSDHQRWKETSIPHVYVLKKEYAARWPKVPVKEAEVVNEAGVAASGAVPPVIQPTAEELEAQTLAEVEAREAAEMRAAGYSQQDIDAVLKGP